MAQHAGVSAERWPGPLGRRWPAILLVTLLHVLLLTALLTLDHPRRLQDRAAPLMQIIRLPEPKRLAPPSFAPLSRLPGLMLPAPPLTGPSFRLPGAPAPATVARPPGTLDLSIHKDAPATVEKVFPGPEARLQHWREEQAEEDATLNAAAPPIGASDCVVVVPKSGDPTAPANGFSVGAIPVTECAPHLTLRALQKRNDLYTPH